MPNFDIHELDSLEPGSDKAEQVFDRYRRALVEQFLASPEGHACVYRHGPAGFWAGCLLDFGFNHVGVTLPVMSSSDLREIVSDYFPRKVSLKSPEDAEDAIPELIAFWRFLGREFGLDAAQTAVSCLEELQATFPTFMNDSSKFGMAKSLFMKGQAAGFDMSDRDQMTAFIAAYNASVETGRGATPAGAPPMPGFPDEDPRVKRNRARGLKRRIAAVSRRTRKKKRP